MHLPSRGHGQGLSPKAVVCLRVLGPVGLRRSKGKRAVGAKVKEIRGEFTEGLVGHYKARRFFLRVERESLKEEEWRNKYWILSLL